MKKLIIMLFFVCNALGSSNVGIFHNWSDTTKDDGHRVSIRGLLFAGIPHQNIEYVEIAREALGGLEFVFRDGKNAELERQLIPPENWVDSEANGFVVTRVFHGGPEGTKGVNSAVFKFRTTADGVLQIEYSYASRVRYLLVFSDTRVKKGIAEFRQKT